MSKQGTAEWLEERLGMITGSKICEIMGTKARRERYLGEVVVQILTGEYKEISAPSLDWGNEHEPAAKAIYNMEFGPVQDVGFVTSDRFPRFGCSPDGLVADDGMIQIKCPKNSINHMLVQIRSEIPKDYMHQVQWEMFVCDRKWSDFVSYDPRIPGKGNLIVQRVARNEEMVNKLVYHAHEFLDMVDQMVEVFS